MYYDIIIQFYKLLHMNIPTLNETPVYVLFLSPLLGNLLGVLLFGGSYFWT